MRPRDICPPEGWVDLQPSENNGIFVVHDRQTDKDIITRAFTLEGIPELELAKIQGYDLSALEQYLPPPSRRSPGSYILTGCYGSIHIDLSGKEIEYPMLDGTVITEFSPYKPRKRRAA